jgi:hypothetical protein
VAEIEKAALDNLSGVERRMMLNVLSERHPRIMKALLRSVDDDRADEVVRAQMPPHRAEHDERLPDVPICFYRQGGAACLRWSEDPLHVPDPGSRSQ